MVLVVVLIALTSFRATRLLARDQFPPLEVQRARVSVRWGDESWQAYLARCPWCLGVWVSGLITATTWAVVGLPVPLLVWGAAAATAGFLSAMEPGD